MTCNWIQSPKIKDEKKSKEKEKEKIEMKLCLDPNKGRTKCEMC